MSFRHASCLLLACFAAPAFAQSIITDSGGGPRNSPAGTSGLSRPVALAAIPGGDVFIVDSGGSRDAVVRLTTSGLLTRVAGYAALDCTAQASLGDGGPAPRSCLDTPAGAAVDASGNLYIADQSHSRIRRVDASTGLITTVAGSGTPGFGGDGALATDPSVRVSSPAGVAVDAAGNLYIADRGNHRVRRVDAVSGIITTAAGNGTRTGSIDGEGGNITDDLGDGGLATTYSLSSPRSVWVDHAGNLLISDSGNFRIRRVAPATGIIITIAGNGTGSYAGENVPATAASLADPRQLVADLANNIYVADFDGSLASNHRVRRVDAVSGTIATVAGGAASGFGGDGGPATSAMLNSPTGVALDGAGGLLIADQLNGRLRRVVLSTGIISTLAGAGDGSGSAATSASLQNPQGVSLGTGVMYIADSSANRVRRKDLASSVIITLAGNGTASSIGDNGPAVSATLNSPSMAVADAAGNVYISERLGHRVRRIDAITGIITTYAGTGTAACGAEGLLATASSLFNPAAVAIDTAGNVLIADAGCNRVRRVNAGTTVINTIAGTGTASFSGDGGAATAATMRSPGGVGLDTSNNIFIADVGNARIRRVSAATGNISTVAGGGGGGDGSLATAALLRAPNGVAVDSSGDLLIAERDAHKVRRVDAGTGLISTVAGSATLGFSGDGGPTAGSRLYRPFSVAVDAAGNLFVADAGNNRIRSVRVNPPAAGDVPDGMSVTRTPLGEITLGWGASCSVNDTDYEIYEGSLGTFGSHAAIYCTTGGATAKTFTPSAGNTYYLVVPRNALNEGSYGQDSGGSERPTGFGQCLPQATGGCS